MATADSTLAAGSRKAPRYVTFEFENGVYTLFPDGGKVYDRWVEVETSRAVQILGAFSRRRQGRAKGH